MGDRLEKLLDAWERGEGERPEDKKALFRDSARHFDGLFRAWFGLEDSSDRTVGCPEMRSDFKLS